MFMFQFFAYTSFMAALIFSIGYVLYWLDRWMTQDENTPDGPKHRAQS